MKKDKRRVTIKLSRRNGKTEPGFCTCPAENSAYCNHVMGLPFEIADYSLQELSRVPEEILCTSHLRQQGVPGDKYTPKSPIMQTREKLSTTRGISSTLYDPRKTQALSVERLSKMQSKLLNANARTGFSNCISPVKNTKKIPNTMHVQFIVALRYHFILIPQNIQLK